MKTLEAPVSQEPGQRWQCPKLLGTRRQLQPMMAQIEPSTGVSPGFVYLGATSEFKNCRREAERGVLQEQDQKNFV